MALKPRLFLPKKVRNVLISAVVLAVLLLGAGAAYVKFSDNQNVTSPVAAVQATTASNAIKPVAPSPKAAEGVAIDMISSPVARGAQASMSITTNAGSTCKIVVAYNKIPAAAAGLTPQTADAFGSVEWTWTIDKTAPLGTGTATVTCVYHGRAGVVIGDLQITK